METESMTDDDKDEITSLDMENAEASDSPKRKENKNKKTKENKKSCASAASKISKVINDLFFPMLETGQITKCTVFDPVNVYDMSLIKFVALQNPALVESKYVFMNHIEKMYDMWVSEH